MRVLGIETSCDETAAAVVEDGTTVLSSVVASQVEKHAEHGGVVPELAAREHVRNIDLVVNRALTEAEVEVSSCEGIAVTATPGLLPALLVGVSYARGLAMAAEKPLAGINHFVAHIFSCFMASPELLHEQKAFPVLALVVSGGHTHLVLIQNDGSARVVGQTLDDAAGEAFDKAAKILDLPYPGGPVIERMARDGHRDVFDFPRALMGGSGKPVAPENRFNFSFSGLKTALLYRSQEALLSEAQTVSPDLLASYQAAIIDVLVAKTFAAAREFRAPSVLMCGGVACNQALRLAMSDAAQKQDTQLIVAPPAYCTDNAAMIAGCGCFYLPEAGNISDITAIPRLSKTLGVVPFTPGYH